ncbi:unnamed protein product [Moneuplotes crassus]|uniref:Uncharacterized protein n=1 Tax=Euplotes crassus TaxID=5936 RepID=A0AAD1XTN9_EUPCR|nr:unnamed protein product [Moneuplotes crassus]
MKDKEFKSYCVFKGDPIFDLIRSNIFNEMNSHEVGTKGKKNTILGKKDQTQGDQIFSEMLTFDNIDFTMRYLNSTLNINQMNITEGSIVLCPFNTSQDRGRQKTLFGRAPIYKKKEDVIFFEPRVRQIDIQYEFDNNPRFDDGVFVSTIKSSKSKSRSRMSTQKSRTRTFTSKNDSSKPNTSFYLNEDDFQAVDKNTKFLAMFGEKGIQEISLADNQKIKLDYNLVYACRRFGYPYVYTLKCMVTKDINYCTAFLKLVRQNS